MGLKNFWNKVVGTVGGVNDDDEFATDEYDDDEVEEEETRPQRRPAAVAPRSSLNYSGTQERPLKMMIVEPESFDDSQSIADYLRDRKPVVINFESTSPDVSKRVVDFISGATYALDGNIQKVGRDIFLCVPSNVTVDRGKHDYGDFKAAPLAWNAPNNANGNGGGSVPPQQ
ncbi:MAG: cell division protein SepF [Megasphaera sp.]|jgi:cell division inhibitor SepF|nr:cell division protein SepF [Megasphaera sp.]MCH4218499.1 cell division protein SepF [Megasphaera sp.]